MDEKIKKIINLDWLSLNYSAISSTDELNNNLILNEPPNFQLERVKGTNVFKSRYYLINELGIKKLTILCDPISHILNKNMMLFEFANNTLYSNEITELFKVMEFIHNGYVNGISRVDFCCDFQKCLDLYGNIIEPQIFLQDLIFNDTYAQGKRERAIFQNINSKENERISVETKQISYGSKTSNLNWKIYNKTKELKEERDKPYIRRMWNLAGFDETKDTYRCEVSIHNANKYSVMIDENTNIFTYDKIKKYKEEIFKIFYLKNFCIRENSQNKNKNRNQKIDFLQIGNSLCIIEQNKSNNDYIVEDAKKLVNYLTKNYTEQLTCFKKEIAEDTFKLLSNTIKQFDLYDYWFKKYQITLDELYFFNFERTNKKEFNKFLLNMNVNN